MEYIDILNEDGEKANYTDTRDNVHKKGLWHRAVHIWVINDNKELLLQKRSPNKDSNPNMWDISSAGHLSAGDDSLDGAVREITEELNVAVTKGQFEYLFTIKASNRYTEIFINNEFDDVYLIKLNLDLSKIKLQESEVSEVRFVYYKDFQKMVEDKVEGLLIRKEEYEKLLKILAERY